MSAEDALQSLLLKLHRREILGWQEELRFGKPIYDALLELVRSGAECQQVTPGALTPHQIANALVVLHRMRAHGTDEEVFAVLKKALSNASQRVRDQAVPLVLGLMRHHHWNASYYNPETRELLSAALEMGVNKDVRARITEVLKREPSSAAT